MAHEHMRTVVVGGTAGTDKVRRSRVVYLSDNFAVLEMSVQTSFPAFGIAQEWCRQAPGTPADTSLFAGASGDEIMVYVNGCIGLAECGGTVTQGKVVTGDSTARIVDAGGAPPFSFYAVGLALESGAAGDVVRVKVGAP